MLRKIGKNKTISSEFFIFNLLDLGGGKNGRGIKI